MSSEHSKKPVMPSKQGDVGLLQDPVAQQLLQVKGPAHLAYTWRDGTPRVIPMGFHWNGEELVMAIPSITSAAMPDWDRTKPLL